MCEPGLAPAVVDFSPYWCPPAFGEALIWHGADPELLHKAASAGA
ncbi:hypothetical protein ACFYWN_45925 [Streptomyces sp. NPDC002917]